MCACVHSAIFCKCRNKYFCWRRCTTTTGVTRAQDMSPAAPLASSNNLSSLSLSFPPPSFLSSFLPQVTLQIYFILLCPLASQPFPGRLLIGLGTLTASTTCTKTPGTVSALSMANGACWMSRASSCSKSLDLRNLNKKVLKAMLKETNGKGCPNSEDMQFPISTHTTQTFSLRYCFRWAHLTCHHQDIYFQGFSINIYMEWPSVPKLFSPLDQKVI